MIYLVTNQISMYDRTLYEVLLIREAINKLEKEDELGLDTETEGLDCFTKKILLLQLGTEEFQVLFFNIADDLFHTFCCFIFYTYCIFKLHGASSKFA